MDTTAAKVVLIVYVVGVVSPVAYDVYAENVSYGGDMVRERACGKLAANLVNRTTAPQVLDLCKSKRSAALEILLKDYASFLHPDKRDEILKMELGNCIKQYIDSEAIQVFANRASWLGNDQLHYTRTWTELDIFDLETLVEQSITAIELEEKKKRLLKDMPKPGKKQ